MYSLMIFSSVSSGIRFFLGYVWCKMYAKLFFVALFVQSGVFAFFDLSDIEDPFSIFWSHKSNAKVIVNRSFSSLLFL